MFILIAAVALLFVTSPQADAREIPAKSETRSEAASLPSDEQLDALLAARNWEGLVTAFESVRSGSGARLAGRTNQLWRRIPFRVFVQPGSMGHW